MQKIVQLKNIQSEQQRFSMNICDCGEMNFKCESCSLSRKTAFFLQKIPTGSSPKAV